MVKKLSLVFMILLISGIFVSAFAAPRKACRDLKGDRCKEREDCSWVDATKGKDGKTVKAYCKCKGKCESELNKKGKK
jgi:hypothetical protein